MRNFILLPLLIVALTGCMTASEHSQSLHSSTERDMTVGIVQAKITRGMGQAEVAEALGSPNIVSRDGNGDEAWIYDKIATEASYSSDTGGVGGLAGAAADVGSTLLLGLGSGSYSRSAGASAVTQKTLTVVIKFDRQQRVKDFSYHASKF